MLPLKSLLVDAVMLQFRLRSGLSVLALCVAASMPCLVHAEPGASIEPREVRQWLMRIHDAASQRNFQGTFVVSAAGAVSSARIFHFFEGTDQFEWIEPLDGQVRYVLRHNNEVHTVWPSMRTVLVEQRNAAISFPSLLVGRDDRISEVYDVQTLKPDRAAGHDANVLLLKPRDGYRYGYRLWAEAQTGLLLRSEVFDERGDVLEVSAFSDVLIGVRSQPELVLQPMHTPAGYRVIKPQMQPTRLDTEGWELRNPVNGFRSLSCFRRPMELGLKADATRPKTSALHAVFSDGMTYVSVFIEPYSEDRHAHPMLSSSGATHTMTSRRGDYWLTVVGDVPAVTLKAFTQSLDRRK